MAALERGQLDTTATWTLIEILGDRLERPLMDKELVRFVGLNNC